MAALDRCDRALPNLPTCKQDRPIRESLRSLIEKLIEIHERGGLDVEENAHGRYSNPALRLRQDAQAERVESAILQSLRQQCREVREPGPRGRSRGGRRADGRCCAPNSLWRKGRRGRAHPRGCPRRALRLPSAVLSRQALMLSKIARSVISTNASTLGIKRKTMIVVNHHGLDQYPGPTQYATLYRLLRPRRLRSYSGAPWRRFRSKLMDGYARVADSALRNSGLVIQVDGRQR